MSKDDEAESDDATAKDCGGKDSNGAAATDKESCQTDDDGTPDDSANELKPVRPKIGESKDNLRQRSDWFKKRHG